MDDATLPASDDLTPEVLARWEELATNATEGPWKWWNLEGEEGDQGWSDSGPNLETVERGPVYSDGSQGARETVLSGWGHDAWGTSVEKPDAEFIAASRTAVPALLSGVRSRDARIAELEGAIADAPHDINCMTGGNGVYSRLQGLPAECDCWKSRYQAGVDNE